MKIRYLPKFAYAWLGLLAVGLVLGLLSRHVTGPATQWAHEGAKHFDLLALGALLVGTIEAIRDWRRYQQT